MVKRETEHLIIQCGLEILCSSGSHGMTMRKVATETGITLSNLQYYFKNRDALLIGMIDYYLAKCTELTNLTSLSCKKNIKKSDIEKFLISLFYNENMLELCKTFREIWAISTRNKVIKEYLDEYYVKSSLLLSKEFENLVTSKKQLNKIITILIPYFEGYSITVDALPFSHKQTARLLTDVLWGILTQDN